MNINATESTIISICLEQNNFDGMLDPFSLLIIHINTLMEYLMFPIIIEFDKNFFVFHLKKMK